MPPIDFRMPDGLRKHFESRLDARDLVVTHVSSARVKGLGEVQAVTATSTTARNVTARAVVDAAGAVHTIEEVEALPAGPSSPRSSFRASTARHGARRP